MGAIIGGVIGGIVGLTTTGVIVGLLWFLSVRRSRRRLAEVDLVDSPSLEPVGEDNSGTPPSRSGSQMIQAVFDHSEIEPFLLSEARSSRPSADIESSISSPGTAAGGVASTVSGRSDYIREQRPSQNTRESSPLSSPTSRGRDAGKGAHPLSSIHTPSFVLHEDAGALDPGALFVVNQEEPIELPPTYSTIPPKKEQRTGNPDENAGDDSGSAHAAPRADS